MKSAKPITVDGYIELYPKPIQARLKKIRSIIKKASPLIEERIGYGMPYYKLKGMLCYFAAHTNHIGYYFLGKTVPIVFKKELQKYVTSKGTIQFPHDKPMDYELIKRIITHRVKENLAKKK